MIRSVIFDIGDTLVESLRDKNGFYEEYVKFLKTHDLQFSMPEIKKAHNYAIQKYKALERKRKQPTDFYFEKQFFLGLGIKKNKTLARLLNTAYLEYRIRTSKLMPNTKETLSELKKSGLLLNVITNTSDDTNRVLAKKYGIYKYFDRFLMSHEEGTIKSEFKIFHLLLEKLNKNRKTKILPNEYLMVGNNLNEDTAARQVGMKTVILTRIRDENKNLQSFEPDYYINDLNEIGIVIAKLNSCNPQ
ncbi:MAG: HAD family hydrolase [Candidatus Diapherotrites archaeon]|nr:HAD family hydrolase [Candidatus Diapherotrites archaeon]